MKFTRAMILAEPVGKQLDTWAAMSIMGWKLYEEESGYGYPGQKDKVWCCPPDWMKVCEAGNWRPSADMADAWVVAEEMVRTGFFCKLQTEEDGWITCFGEVDPDDFEFPGNWVYAPTAPQSIVQAALLVLPMELD